MAREVEQLLAESLYPFLSPYDFEAEYASCQFRRKDDRGFSSIIISTGGTLPALVELHLGIRLDLVEQLAYQFTSGLAEYGPHSTTLITSAGRILGQPYHRFSLDRLSDVSQIATQIRQFMLEYGFAFLEKYRRIEALDELFNATPHEKSPYFTHRLHRSLRGIILGKLVDRPHWERLVTGYRAQLTLHGTPEPMMHNYDRLADYLRAFSIN